MQTFAVLFDNLSTIILLTVRRGDVLAAWSGIRPLVTNPNSTDTQSISRNHVVDVGESGLVTIAGNIIFWQIDIFYQY